MGSRSHKHHHHHLLVLLLAMEMVHVVMVMADSPTPGSNDRQSQDVVTAFKPSLGVVIGILSIMFSLTFIVLVYAKFCHSAAAARHLHRDAFGALTRTRSQLSGIDKKVIESLPFFRFSALKGSREGLECAVCLSKFEDVEMLRLLPVCKHAFHIACIDQWLEKHSTCPLCRHKINPTDPQFFAYSDSLRFLQGQSEGRAEPNVEVFIEREEENSESGRLGSSSRFGIGSSFRTAKKGDRESLILRVDDDEEPRGLHRFNHKIVVSDVVFKNRWSSVTSSDLMFLNSEILRATASDRFNNSRSGDDIVEEEASFAGNRTRVVSQSEKRSMSEITGMSRLKIHHKRLKDTVFTNEGASEERRRRIWFPIAQRTVQWFADRENRRKHDSNSKNTRQNLEV
uniref:RING-type E3 ubiquitin transferase n=1 Tax=Kalanchoe fedtschenkoi TaxID=63787 RepID=A0A7N0TVU8_KALFE